MSDSASMTGAASGSIPPWLAGATFRSDARGDARYALERVIGRGGFADAVLAERHAPEGRTPVVLKVMRPEVVQQSDAMVARLFKKEVVALGRLNERVPPTPFVVRLLDTGEVDVTYEGRAVTLPWLSVEYVSGGVEGETLSKRVRYAVAQTGFAFDPDRVATLTRQLVAGLMEIHAAGVVHRDLKPGNVLCCGFGATEVAKISDFGIARPSGVISTFGDIALGTPGYIAPEQVHLREEIGPATDLFSLAAIVFFMLTGERYFDVKSAIDGVLAATERSRRNLRQARKLSPELVERADVCQALDAVLTRATAPDPRARYRHAAEFGDAIATALQQLTHGQPSERWTTSVLSLPTERIVGRDPSRWEWVPRHRPGGERVMIDVAWESDAHCLAVSAHGLCFWGGDRWVDFPHPAAWPVRFARRAGPGQWLLITEPARWLVFDHQRVHEPARLPFDGSVTAVAGDPSELIVLASAQSALVACDRGRFLQPVAVPGVIVTGLARLDTERFLVTGRRGTGGAFAAIFFPHSGELREHSVAGATALVCAAGFPARGIALAAGGRHVVIATASGVDVIELDGGAHWSACGIDVSGGRWLAAAGRVWYSAGDGAPWVEVWRDAQWTAPFVSLHADADRVLLVTADGGVLEGRAARGIAPSPERV